MSCYIVGTGSALPERIVNNLELANDLGVTPDWIEANSGIRERRWANNKQSTSDLAFAAVQTALVDAELKSEEIDYLIGGTISPDYRVPGITPLVQRKLISCGVIPTLDVRVGCATILYSLQIARGLIASQAAKTVACFGAETQSKGLDLHPRSAEISMLFGDGAGAFIVSHQPAQKNCLLIEDILIASDGNFAEDLCVLDLPKMNGRTVILHAVRKLISATLEILQRNHLSTNEIELIVPHQANLNLLRMLGKQLEIEENRIVVNVNRYGNTSSASAFIALAEAPQISELPNGANILLLAFGTGFTWGAALLRKIN